MYFQNPKILYFLSLLIIPILVHLFQLQKFVKVPFTNVAFLKQIKRQNRKSSRLKKWLILATRLLLLSAIIFAFSQPYFSKKKTDKKQHTFIYLDNSLSTNSIGEKGNLLKVAAQEIIENASKKDIYSLQTNTNYFDKITYEQLKTALLNIKNSSNKVDFQSILLKIDNANNEVSNTLNKSILISDFQGIYADKFTNVTTRITGIPLKNITKNNISIDSVFTTNSNLNNITINTVIKNQGEAKNNIPIAIFNENKLISKQAFSIKENEEKTIVFTLQEKDYFLGKLNITFSDTFTHDNTFYFSINNSKKINVLSIGNKADFLSKIYTKNEFILTEATIQNVNYNAIAKQQIIILNELQRIPETLQQSLVKFCNSGGSVVIIPNSKIEFQTYNLFLNKIAKAQIRPKISDTLKITNINFNHPLFENVFLKEVKNFQYPIVKSYSPISSVSSGNIISFENNTPFISELKIKKGKMYWIASSLSSNNSNFINSPLIVPIFINFAKSSFQKSKLYYYLDNINKIDIDTNLNKDEVLSLKNMNSSFIPPQETFQNKVSITTKDNPTESGFYHIMNKKDTIQTITYNNPKEESLLSFLDTKSVKLSKNINFSDSISEVFNDLNKKNEVHWLWKWFLALAIVSLLLEILILKFYKP